MGYNAVLNLIFIFLIYSFVGWILEVLTVAVKDGKFVNRGITNGPLCPIYGITSIIIILITRDFENIFGIFIASVIYGTFIEFLTGKILEKINRVKWWNYSKKKFNFEGYVCLEYSLLWGLLGVILVKLINPLFIGIFNNINIFIRSVICFSLFGIAIIDFLTSFISIKLINTKSLENASNKLGNFILTSVKKRIENAYPNVKHKKNDKSENEKFAEGLNFYKLFLIFLIGAFIGDICEIVFCRFTMHRWMSRSSLVFGQLSIVWGAGLALATLCLHRYRNKKNFTIFIIGCVMGGAFEYVCSVFTEVLFGTIFWDYSHIPFNINGRINLLFCFFWGFAAVLFIKRIYPLISNIIENIPKKLGAIITNILFIIFVIDLIITGCVMLRYNARKQGYEANNIIEKLCDQYADDEYMKSRWSNMKNVIEE